MSTTSSAPGQDIEAAVETGILGEGKLHISLADAMQPLLDRDIVPLEGECSEDLFWWDSQTLDRNDRRNLQPLTMRFLARDRPPGSSFRGRHDDIRRAIWQAVGNEMNKANVSGPLPSVIVEENPFNERKSRDCIDVSFDDGFLLSAILAKLSRIEIVEVDEEPWQLSLSYFSGTLPRDILPFDVLRLPVTQSNSKAVMQSLTTMMASVGTVLGIGKIHYPEEVLGRSLGPTQVTRDYLKLSRKSMTLPFNSLISQIPTHMVWKRASHSLQYAGRDLHDAAVHSDDFPPEDVEEEDQASTSTDANGASSSKSTGESNKRKRSRK